MSKKNLYINDVNLGTYGIYITSDTILNLPRIDYNEFFIYGRDGNTIQYNNRLDNVIRKFTCYVPENYDKETAITQVKKLLYSNIGYLKIASDYEPGLYQYGYLAQEIVVNPFDNYKTLQFDLYFSCVPKKISDTAATSSYAIATTNNIEFLPRSHRVVQKMLNNITPSEVPDSKAFAMYSVSGASANATVNISASFPNQFIGVIITNGYVLQQVDLNAFVGYTVTGNFSINAYQIPANGFYGFLVPADAVGELNISITKNGTTTTKTQTFAPVGEITSSTMMGADTILDIRTHDCFLNSIATLTIDPVAYIMGSMNGQKTWEGLINISQNGKEAFDQFPHPSYADVVYNIDSQTFETTATANNTTINGASFIEIIGDLSGRCDKISIFVYSYDQTGNDQGYIDKVDVMTRWWTL